MVLDPQERFQELFAQEAYRRRLRQMALNDERSITLDFMELSVFDEELARGILERPEDYLRYAASALRAQMRYEDEQYAEAVERFHVRIRGLPDKISIRGIGARHIERLVAFDGIVVRATPVKPLLTEAVFRCKCGAENRVAQQGSYIRPPLRCESCGRTTGFELLPEKSKFIDYQELRVQERPEDLPPGQLPRYVEVYLEDDLVDCARPGDRVTVTGIVRARAESMPGKGKLRTFNIVVDANHVETVGKEPETLEVTPGEERQIRELALQGYLEPLEHKYKGKPSKGVFIVTDKLLEEFNIDRTDFEGPGLAILREKIASILGRSFISILEWKGTFQKPLKIKPRVVA